MMPRGFIGLPSPTSQNTAGLPLSRRGRHEKACIKPVARICACYNALYLYGVCHHIELMKKFKHTNEELEQARRQAEKGKRSQ